MARMKRIAVYAGSFDPLTNGHLWMIRQGARMFDELIVAIGDNPDKHYTFSHEERMTMLRVALSDMPDVRMTAYSELPASRLMATMVPISTASGISSKAWRGSLRATTTRTSENE